MSVWTALAKEFHTQPLVLCARHALRWVSNLLHFWSHIPIVFKRFYLFIFREGKGGRREGEKHQCVVASRVPPTGDLARNPGMCPKQELSQRPFGSQAGTQSTEPHQQGPSLFFYPPLSAFLICPFLFLFSDMTMTERVLRVTGAQSWSFLPLHLVSARCSQSFCSVAIWRIPWEKWGWKSMDEMVIRLYLTSHKC